MIRPAPGWRSWPDSWPTPPGSSCCLDSSRLVSARHHLHRADLSSAFGGPSRPGRYGRRHRQHTAPGRHSHRCGAPRHPLCLARYRQDPAHLARLLIPLTQPADSPPRSAWSPAPGSPARCPAGRAAAIHAARAGTAGGINDVLFTAAAIAAPGAIAALVHIREQPRQPRRHRRYTSTRASTTQSTGATGGLAPDLGTAGTVPRVAQFGA